MMLARAVIVKATCHINDISFTRITIYNLESSDAGDAPNALCGYNKQFSNCPKAV